MRHFFLVCLILSSSVVAQTTFPYGNGIQKWGVPLKVPDSELELRLGARYQGLATIEEVEDAKTGEDVETQDFQSRRLRFQFQGELQNQISFYMDVRNDNVNEDDRGEGNFTIGDAFVAIPLAPSHNIRLYRSKIDVARTQTVSSSELLFLNRPAVSDEAAQFVSHGRRATNVQVIGTFARLLSYQLAVGDGVFSDRFKDAKGKAITDIETQNFMVGGKLRLHLLGEDIKPTETYFGKGHHLSVGAGLFNTSDIEIVNANKETGTISRTLINVEASGHYQEWSLFSEYFKMQGVIENHSAASFNTGAGEGWYVQGEKLFTNFHYLAPFARYETWNRFIESGDYESMSTLYGVNWYLNGNRFRVSLAYQREELGASIKGNEITGHAYHLASMWHF